MSQKDNQPLQIGLVVNGPNILSKRFNIRIEDIPNILRSLGRIVIGKVVLNHNIAPKLVEIILDSGLEPIIVNGRVDVAVAVETMKIIYNPKINILALGVRDAHFMPLVIEAKKMGKEVIIITPKDEISDALQNTADKVIELSGNQFRDWTATSSKLTSP
ncbi:NYN domain-containing protein [Thermococcus argininiproducens]|uniref:NYN domain-containing protein n=1 Tax=Thermococcus argininiproducens TaxID=2866384 RepID=A0A9E7SBY0_9EURY|nr:NYN domain-containing protein [Thermococcus argininiproducens]USG99319.1 NYN domain-containing protein [Thermococcus argininiproducens]